MSALVTPGILRELELEREQDARLLSLDPGEQCRFCLCTEVSPCAIPLREGPDGNFYLARAEEETTLILPCVWFIPRVCNSPHCIEKLLVESRNRVVLFDGTGRRMA